MSDDFTRCYGSVSECVQFIPHTSSFERIETLYSKYLQALCEKPNCKNFGAFYSELVNLEREGKLELAPGSEQGDSQLNRVMEDCFKQLLKKGAILRASWVYRKI